MLSHRLRRIRNEHFDYRIGSYFNDRECDQVALGPDLFALYFHLTILGKGRQER